MAVFAFVEALYSVINCGCNVLGISFNTILILAILFNSPPQIQTYGFLLIANAATDMVTCFITLWVQPRVVTYQESLIYVNNGLCKYFTPNSCMFGYGIMVVLYAHMTWSLLVSFVYRWYVLQHETLKKRYMLLLIGVIYVPMIVEYCILVPYVLDQFDSDFQEELVTVHPEMDVNGKKHYHFHYESSLAVVITGAQHVLTDWRASIPTAAITMPIFPVTLFIIILRKKILKKLDQHTVISATTRRMHRDFLRALTLQTFLPSLFVLGISLFMLDMFFQIHHVVLEEGLYFIMGLIPMISPIFPLYYVLPYRNFVLARIFRRKRRIVSNIASDVPPNSDLQSSRVVVNL